MIGFLVFSHTRTMAASGALGHRPPEGLGIRCISTLETAWGHVPDSSAQLRKAARAYSKGWESNWKARGWIESIPTLVPALKDAAVFLISLPVMGVNLAPTADARHGADGVSPSRVQTACHSPRSAWGTLHGAEVRLGP